VEITSRLRIRQLRELEVRADPGDLDREGADVVEVDPLDAGPARPLIIKLFDNLARLTSALQ